jgi:hypothetical protein
MKRVALRLDDGGVCTAQSRHNDTPVDSMVDDLCAHLDLFQQALGRVLDGIEVREKTNGIGISAIDIEPVHCIAHF